MVAENKVLLLSRLQMAIKCLQIKQLFPYFLRHLKMKQVGAPLSGKTCSMPLARSDLATFSIPAEARGTPVTTDMLLPIW